MTVVFSDLHLRESTADVCFKVLDAIQDLALAGDQHVVCCGDFWHLRYQVTVRLLNRVVDLFDRWSRKGIRIDLLPGNHDQVSVDGANALEALGVIDRVTVWTEGGGLFGGDWWFVPYRKDPQEQQRLIVEAAGTDAKIIFGHFAVGGAVMNNGRVDREGVPFEFGDRLRWVLGHYHKSQNAGSWCYVGSPYQTSFGEAGNVCGCLRINDAFESSFVPLDVGAPRHYILEWDPSESDEPPPHPGTPHDHVRLDIKASREMIVGGKFKGVLKRSGLDDAQVNVVPVVVEREHRFDLGKGESLLQAAERFARERLADKVEDNAVFDQSFGAVMDPLMRWAR